MTFLHKFTLFFGKNPNIHPHFPINNMYPISHFRVHIRGFYGRTCTRFGVFGYILGDFMGEHVPDLAFSGTYQGILWGN